MQQINVRGTFLCTKHCLPYLRKSAQQNRNPHIVCRLADKIVSQCIENDLTDILTHLLFMYTVESRSTIKF